VSRRDRDHGARRRDDAGGVWIRTGVALGALVYAGVLVMAAAGFTAVLPLVVLPPVLVGVIGAANLLGGRTHGRGTGAPARGGPPLSSSGSSGPNGARGSIPADHGPDEPGRAR
jgi:hypothetical protein